MKQNDWNPCVDGIPIGVFTVVLSMEIKQCVMMPGGEV